MKYNLPKLNLILIAVSFIIIVVGFALMVGEPSGATEYNPDIFSTRRITVGPMIALLGFVMMIAAILFKKKDKE
jgi:NADH:ubiquinone oxidoreductase subunit 2 (subunit N)